MTRAGRLRRWARKLGGVAFVSAAHAVVVAGWLPAASDGQAAPAPGALGIACVALVVAAVVWAMRSRLAYRPPSARLMRLSTMARLAPHVVDVEVGVAMAAAVYTLVAVTAGWLHPAAYLLAAFAATFLTAPAAWITLSAMVVAELAGPDLPAALTHVGFILLSGALHALFLRGFFAVKRREHVRDLDEAVRAMRDEAREFRVIATALGAESRARRPREEEEGKLAEGAVESIHASMYHTLELLKRSLELETVVLLWLDLGGEKLRIKEMVTDSDAVLETPIGADVGALGAVVKDRILINLTRPRKGQVPYYAGGEEPGAFVGVPVLEDGHLRGVLCADRSADRPFDREDEKLLEEAAVQILRSIQNERVFAAVERAKYEHERFFHASSMLGKALTPEQVMDTAIDAAREIVEFDLASITLFDKEARRHRVARVHVREGLEDMVDQQRLDGLEFRDNAGLTSMVVKNKHYLPAGGELRDHATPVFTKSIRLKGAESLLVLPLVCADEAIGTFTLASRERHAFRNHTRDMLGVIANQVAVSLENATLFRRMEQMATTDGLTGLLNHRAFQDRLADLLSRSERHGLTLSMILTDIDHFKKINDTYGHPVGDQVLRIVSGILAEMVRKIDVVARYGGEEFAIVIDGSDPEGAQKLAERIRNEVAERIFQSDKGPFRVTLSLGIAGCPVDAKDKHTLVERADQALYHAKHNGRNKSVTYAQMCAARSSRAAKAG